MKKYLIYITICILSLAGTLLSGKQVQSLEGTEFQIKAAMMVNFIQFVEWPEDDPNLPVDSIILGIIGEDNFGNTLDQIEGRIINGKRLTILRFNTLKDLNKCQVLFVPESESYRMYEILKSVNGYPILTIGESEGFTQLGGVISFYLEKNHIRFEINKSAALNSNLRISAKLMEIARVVE